MKQELTDAGLRAIKPPATGRVEIWDTKARDLVLRITPGGAMTWAVRARTHDGKRTRATLGQYPAIGIAKARDLALKTLARIHDKGDPVAERQAARAARDARTTLPTVAERMTEWQAARSAKWSVRYAAEVARIVAKDISPKLGNRPLVETTRGDWTGLVADKRKKRSAKRKDHQPATAMASLIYRVCSAFLGHAEAHGWISVPLLPRKGLTTIAPPPESRARVLSDAELRAIWQASATLNPKPRAFVRLLILTAAREMEVADIPTGEIDRATCRWTIPATRAKNGVAITLPLNDLAIAELRPLWPTNPERAGPGRRLLGDIVGNGFRGFSKLKTMVDKESGVSGWRWHDLRRTARTGMTRLGVPRDHAEAAINHVSGRTALERTYDRHDYSPEVIDALTLWQAHVAKRIAQPPGGEAE